MSEKRNPKNIIRRAGWLLLVLLFAGTAVGIGVVSFWQATHQKDDSQTQQDTMKLQGSQLSNFTPIAKIDQLQAIDLKVGSGGEVKADSIVTAHYTGAMAATGVIFQSSLDAGQPFSIKLSEVIAGWTEGIPGMKVGGERRLLIPAAKAYGANPPPGSGIPPNADLVFDIILLNVQ